MRHHLRLLTLLCLPLLLEACAPGLSAEQSATATARAADIPRQATTMARQHRLTQLAGETQVTATAQAALDFIARARQWPLRFSEPFGANTRDWAEGAESGQYADASWTINGLFRWEVTAHEGFVWWNYPEMDSVSDFYLAVDARQVGGPADGYLGLIFRHSTKDDYLAYTVAQDGQFALDQHTANGWETLLPAAAFAAIHPYEVNRLEVAAQGERLWLLVNGQLAATYEQAGLSEGKCGVIVGMNNANDAGVFEFDNFEVRTPLEPINIQPTATP